jgi:hypothetical protein
LEFSTFNPKFFRIFKFRAGNFSARELSIRKNSGCRNFSANVPGAIGRAGILAGACAPSAGGGFMGVFPGFDMIVRKFFRISNFRTGFFWDFQLSSRIFFGP